MYRPFLSAEKYCPIEFKINNPDGWDMRSEEWVEIDN
jgi:hypothetical protein